MKIGRRASGLLSCCLAALLCGQARADGFTGSPLMPLHAEHALNAIFGLPGAAARASGEQGWQLSLEHANQFFGSRHATDCLPQSDCTAENDNGSPDREQLYLDGETSELTLRYRRAVGSCWQGEFQMRLLQHHGGRFDRAIEDWHDFFGMPDAGRQYFEVEQLTYRYADASGERVRVDRPQSGIGDILFTAQRALRCHALAESPDRQTLLRIGLKLPTGSVSELRGSGRVDGFFDVQSPVYSLGLRVRAAASLGLLRIGHQRRLPEQERLVGFGTLGLQLGLTRRYSALAQIDWHTPFYQSALPELGEATVVLSTGLRYRLSALQSLEVTISEDLKIESAPDIVGRLAWIHHAGP